ncbi:DUF2782 domain-containing protein [Aidingimonas lacisalsi]|uniref:DUF2782 domain-containing protein n=1 Tax=Aidingimonas lacisalsi TaxID=2604086 RepID=UPI0011D28D54|nr:DUF2782 domain-containing protein [Aidingimonas lacisalsi]
MRGIKSLIAVVGTTAFIAGPGLVSAQEPDITERQEDDRVIREYRYQGQLYAIEVRPDEGTAYTLIDHDGDGDFEREASGQPGIPDWLQDED